MSNAIVKKVRRILSRQLDAAEVKGDAQAVASLSRALLATLSEEKAEAPRPTQSEVQVSEMNAEELATLDQVLESMDRLKERVRQRILVDGARSILDPPKPVMKVVVRPSPEPEPAPVAATPERPEFLFDDEVIENGLVIEIDPETQERTVIGTVAEVQEEGDDDDE